MGINKTTTWRAWCLGAVLGLSAVATQAETDAATAQWLWNHSSLSGQLAGASTQIAGSLRVKLAQQQVPVTEQKRLLRLAEQAFDGARMQARGAAVYRQRLEAQHIEDLRRWYTSTPGAAVSKAETSAAAQQSVDLATQLKTGTELLQQMRGDRMAMLRDIKESQRVPELLAGVVYSSTRALYLGLEQGKRGSRPLSERDVADIDALLEQQRGVMLHTFETRAMPLLALAFERISTEQLEAYAEFLHSPAAQHWVAVTQEAMSVTLADSGHAFDLGLMATVTRSKGKQIASN